MLDQDIRSWIVRYGELITLAQRVLKECSAVCASLSLRYLIIMLGLELSNFCKYLTDKLRRELDSNCREVLKELGIKEDLIDNLMDLASISKALTEGKDVNDDVLIALVNRLPEGYAFLSRVIFQHMLKRL